MPPRGNDAHVWLGRGALQVLDGGEEVAVLWEAVLARMCHEVPVWSPFNPVSGPVRYRVTGVRRGSHPNILFPNGLSFEARQAHGGVVSYPRKCVVGEPEFYRPVRRGFEGGE